MSEHALKVLYRLKNSGFQAYLVGGCVRDLLLGREPKDFDVVTDAHPDEIRATFRNCRLIGRRFRLAHIHFGRDFIEVATFRGSTEQSDHPDRQLENGRLICDNIYGSIEEDIWRRDFTVNALYYNIADFSVVDYAGGMEDHQASTLRLIGDPEERYREDPVRMLRAVRFAVKLGFTIHPDCEAPLFHLSHLLKAIPPARLYDETLKLFLTGYAIQSFELLRHYGLFEVLFAATEQCLAIENEGYPLTFLAKALANSDRRIAEGQPVTGYFLFAALLWEPVRTRAEALQKEGQNDIEALQQAANEILSTQVKQIALPRRVTQPMREVWVLQARLTRRTGGRPMRLLGHPRFRAAYDFLLLRADSGEAEPALAEWWTRFQQENEEERQKMVKSTARKPRRRPRRRRPNSSSPPKS